MSTSTDIRPRVKEAGELFLGLPEGNERSYKTVADRMGVTEGRAGVYVREYLKATDQEDKAPQRGRRSGNGSGSTANALTDVIEQTIEQYTHQIDRFETNVQESAEAVATFDADEFKANAAQEMRDAIAEITARLTAWEADEGEIATKSATDTLADLTKSRDRIAEEAEQKLTFLRGQRDAAEQTLETLKQAAEAMAAANATPPVTPPAAA